MVIKFPNLFTGIPIRRIARSYYHIFPGMLGTDHRLGYNFLRPVQCTPEVMYCFDEVVIEEELLGAWFELQLFLRVSVGPSNKNGERASK